MLKGYSYKIEHNYFGKIDVLIVDKIDDYGGFTLVKFLNCFISKYGEKHCCDEYFWCRNSSFKILKGINE